MKVDSSKVSENQKYLKELIGKQRREIVLREQELDNIQTIYNKKADQERLVGEEKLLDIHDRNQAEMIEATKQREEKLANLKEEYQKTQQTLQKQEDTLKKQHVRRVENVQDAHMIKTRDLFDEAQEQVKEINLRNNNKIQDVYSKTNRELGKIRHKSQIAIDKAAYENDLRVTQAQNGQADAMKKSQERFEIANRRQEMEHKNALDNQILKNQTEFKVRERIHKDRTEATEKHYDELMKGEKLAFESKYKTMIKEHQEVLDRLKTAFDQRMKDMIKGFSDLKTSKAEKYQDEFYTLDKLSPRVREDQKFYYIEIDTPPHEKENYHITAHGRNIKLMFNRRSEERLDEPNGGVQTSKKSETLRKEFKVAEIVDDRKLKVNYEDGVLSYRLPKA